LGGNDVGGRPARDHAYFLALIASAKDLAAGLVKSAENVSTYKPPRPNYH
jgi:hypothetical protein